MIYIASIHVPHPIHKFRWRQVILILQKRRTKKHGTTTQYKRKAAKAENN